MEPVQNRYKFAMVLDVGHGNFDITLDITKFYAWKGADFLRKETVCIWSPENQSVTWASCNESIDVVNDGEECHTTAQGLPLYASNTMHVEVAVDAEKGIVNFVYASAKARGAGNDLTVMSDISTTQHIGTEVSRGQVVTILQRKQGLF